MSDQNEIVEEGGSGSGFLNYLPAILWQRRWLIAVPFLLLSAAGLAVAMLLPTTYRSSATLLVESQELPSSMVTAASSTIIDQRIAKIRQQVLSRGDLITLIEQNDLYPDERRSKPLSTIVDKMQHATSVQAVDSDIGQGQASSGSSNTIAFAMSFDYRDPVKAQAVMQSFVSRFLEIDSTSTQEQATNTVNFLQDQGKKLQDQIAQLEAKITSIKAQNGLALATTGTPSLPVTASYEAQIAALQTENRQLLSQSRKVSKDPMVAAAEAQLASARSIYADTHPDVIRAKQRLKELQDLAKADGPPADVGLMQSQIAANNQQIAALGQMRSSDSARASSTLAAQSHAPVVMEQVMQLDGQANALRLQYQDVSSNILKAQNTARMAREQKGEHLSVVDAPSAPDTPVWPNRPLLILGGIAAGLGLGLVMAILLEFLLKPVRGVDQLQAMGLETLAVVPFFKPDEPGRQKRSFGRLRRRTAPITSEDRESEL